MASDFPADEPAPMPVPVPFDIRRWLFPAAGLAAAAVLAIFVARPMLSRHDLDDVKAASKGVPRLSTGRLAGFPHEKEKGTLRGADDLPDTDAVAAAKLRLLVIAADEAVRDPHVRGLAVLLAAEKADDVDGAIQLLRTAYEHASTEDRDAFATDLAAALLARDRWGSSDSKKTAAEADRERAERDQFALQLSNEVWQRKHTPEAAWNRAAALQALGKEADALQAWNDYLKLDSTSDWAKEAATQRSKLIDDPTR
jgi:hypothetical protein